MKNRRLPLSYRRKQRKNKYRLLLTIIIIIFLSYFVFVWFLPTLIGGLSFLNDLKPKNATPLNVADNNVLAPPVFNIPFEATNTAIISVKGYTAPSLKVAVYLDDQLIETVQSQTDGSFQTDLPLVIGTNNLYGKTLNEQGEKSLPSKNIQIFYIVEKPVINLQNPSDNQEIKGGDKKVTVSGTVSPAEKISLEVNGSKIIVNSDGSFNKIYPLTEGDNQITVTATDRAGNSSSLNRLVTYYP